MAAALTSSRQTGEAKSAGTPKVAALRAAAVLSGAAATIHVWAALGHFREWWGYGLIFLATAVVQAVFAAGLLRRPDQPFLLAVVAGNLAIVGGYVLTRTVGVPFLGPHAWHPEKVGALDLAATASEVALAVAVVPLLVGGYRAAVGHALLLFGVAGALAAGGWGVLASLGAEPPAASVGSWAQVPGGLLRVDRVAPERMAPMQMNKFGEQGMSMGASTGMDMAPDGQRRFAVDVTLAAGEGGELAYSPDRFRLTGAGVEATAPIRDTLSEGSVPAGGRISGTLVFQAPETAEDLKVSLSDGGTPVALPLEPTASKNEGATGGNTDGNAGGGHDH